MPHAPAVIRSRGSIRSAARRALTAPDQPPAAWLAGPTLPQRLDAARRELAAAGDDFRRLEIRDAAAAIKAAADVLDRRDVAVLAAELVADCERAIAKANPPRPAGRPSGKNRSPGERFSGGRISAGQVRKLRSAHAMPDRVYEEAKRRARERQEPITRAALLEHRRAAAPRRTRPASNPTAAADLRKNLVAARDMAAGARDAGDVARALVVAGRVAVLMDESLALLDAALPAARR